MGPHSDWGYRKPAPGAPDLTAGQTADQPSHPGALGLLERHIPGPQALPKLMEGNTLVLRELSDDKGIGPGLGARTLQVLGGGDTAPVYRAPMLMEETQLLPSGRPWSVGETSACTQSNLLI